MMAIILLFGLCTNVFADGNVTYDGASRRFVFEPGTEESPTSLFENFSNVMPGDKLEEQIVVKNTSQNGSYIRLYLRSLGAQEETDAFLSQMKLTVKGKGDATLFEAPANETAQLKDWVYLGAIHSGGTVKLDLTLEVPIEMDYRFQNQVGYIDWQFMAEEIPRDPNAVQTGDTSNIFAYGALLAICLVAIVIIIIIAKRKKKREE